MQIRDRKARIQVGPVDVTGLRVTFRVERTIRTSPNQLEVVVYNLSDESRSRIDESRRRNDTNATDGLGNPLRRVFVQLEAGYADATFQIFKGDVRKMVNEVKPPDVVTRIFAGDGEASAFGARVNRSFPRGTSVETVLNHLAESMAVGIGNAVSAFRGVSFGQLTQYQDGTIVSGPAHHEMDVLCRSAGLEWSIQDNVLQVVRVDDPIGSVGVELSPDSGLIGSPSRDPVSKIVKGKCFIIPDVRPGRQVRVTSRFVNEVIRINKATFVGDTHGSDWYIEFEGRRPPTRDIFGNRLV